MEAYDTFLAFAPNERELGSNRRQSGLKDMASQLGLEGWRICGVWQTIQGGVQGFGILCQRPQGEAVIYEEAAVAELYPLREPGNDRQIETVTVTALQIEEGFTCPQCGLVSHHPNDVVEGYCAHCRAWTGGAQPA